MADGASSFLTSATYLHLWLSIFLFSHLFIITAVYFCNDYFSAFSFCLFLGIPPVCTMSQWPTNIGPGPWPAERTQSSMAEQQGCYITSWMIFLQHLLTISHWPPWHFFRARRWQFKSVWLRQNRDGRSVQQVEEKEIKCETEAIRSSSSRCCAQYMTYNNICVFSAVYSILLSMSKTVLLIMYI